METKVRDVVITSPPLTSMRLQRQVDRGRPGVEGDGVRRTHVRGERSSNSFTLGPMVTQPFISGSRKACHSSSSSDGLNTGIIGYSLVASLIAADRDHGVLL